MRPRDNTVAKIIRPSAQGILPRKRLFHWLDESRNYPVTWISSPGGSGKTTLASSYLAARELPGIWYQIDEGDADPATFFQYMEIAVQRLLPRRKVYLPRFTPEYVRGLPAFTRRYFEELYNQLISSVSSSDKTGIQKQKRRKAVLLVFDNYQDVAPQSLFHEMISLGLEIIPEGIHVVILSRTSPPPFFARLLANSKIRLMGWEEMQFNLEEIGSFFRAKGEKGLPQEVFLLVQQKTHGWAAGLILLILAARMKKGDYRSILTELPVEIYDYLGNEIFEKVGNEERDFFLKTAFLPRMTISMAEKLTGIAAARKILSELIENHYLMESFSHSELVLQHHPLLREFLLAKIERLFTPEEKSQIQVRSAQILEESGQIEEAAKLYLQMEKWDCFVQLVEKHGMMLLEHGKNRTVQDWIESIPEKILENSPTLLYLLGFCKINFDTVKSLALFQQSFHLFENQGDTTGSLASWARIIGGIYSSLENCELLDRYIDWLDDWMREGKSFPNPTVEAQVSVRMAIALFLRRPARPDIEKWIDRSLSLLGEVEDKTLRLMIMVEAARYFFYVGEFIKGGLLLDDAEKFARSQKVHPHILIMLNELKVSYTLSTTQDYQRGLRLLSESSETAQEYGIDVPIPRLYAMGVRLYLTKGDVTGAIESLKKMEACQINTPYLSFYYHYLKAGRYMFQGDLLHSLAHGEEALKVALSTGIKYYEVMSRLLIARVLHRKGDWQRADEEFSISEKLNTEVRSFSLKYHILMVRVQFSFNHGNEEEGLDFLRRAMELGREQGYIYLGYPYESSMMARLCAKALAAGIEVQYVQNLIRKRNLVLDPPPFEIDQWPWPLKIYTLGKFELLRDGKPLQFSGKVQKKPLHLLKALIAQGGKEVKEEQLSDMLWPEADGDQAYSTFRTTLSRLRQLIGNEKAIDYHDGKAAIDPRYCWVDAWAFGRIFEQIEAESKSLEEDETHGNGEVEKVMRLIEKAISVYQGHFLSEEKDEFWTTSYRERLRNKYLLLITRLGNHLQKKEQWEKAVENYQKALEVDQLAEEFYQHLMICYRHLGQNAKAIEVYKRCRMMLGSVFGIEPSPKTEAIHKTLIGNAKV